MQSNSPTGVIAKMTAGNASADSLPQPIWNQALARLRNCFGPVGGGSGAVNCS
jgi:hypothetical protein